MVVKGFENPEMLLTLNELRKAAGRTKKALWKRTAELLGKPNRRQAEVNLYEIDKHCGQGEVAVVPGKVLSTGVLSKKMTVVAVCATQAALKKISSSGSKFVSLREFAAKGDSKQARLVI